MRRSGLGKRVAEGVLLSFTGLGALFEHVQVAVDVDRDFVGVDDRIRVGNDGEVAGLSVFGSSSSAVIESFSAVGSAVVVALAGELLSEELALGSNRGIIFLGTGISLSLLQMQDLFLVFL